jgi:hypothetical protein
MGWKIDSNEIFMLFCTTGAIVLFMLIQKKIHPAVEIAMWLWTILLVEIIDYMLGVPPLDLYDYFDGPNYQPSLAIVHFFMFPAVNGIMLNIYENHKLNKRRKILLIILAFTIISAWFEWLCTKMGVLSYKNWSLLLSIPTYPAAILLSIGTYHIFSKSLLKEFLAGAIKREG